MALAKSTIVDQLSEQRLVYRFQNANGKFTIDRQINRHDEAICKHLDDGEPLTFTCSDDAKAWECKTADGIIKIPASGDNPVDLEFFAESFTLSTISDPYMQVTQVYYTLTLRYYGWNFYKACFDPHTETTCIDFFSRPIDYKPFVLFTWPEQVKDGKRRRTIEKEYKGTLISGECNETDEFKATGTVVIEYKDKVTGAWDTCSGKIKHKRDKDFVYAKEFDCEYKVFDNCDCLLTLVQPADKRNDKGFEAGFDYYLNLLFAKAVSIFRCDLHQTFGNNDQEHTIECYSILEELGPHKALQYALYILLSMGNQISDSPVDASFLLNWLDGEKRVTKVFDHWQKLRVRPAG